MLILGVGFDARTLRMPATRETRVPSFEVDFADQLARRRGILDAAGIEGPSHIHAVPCDFQAADFERVLRDGLGAAGFDFTRATAVVWEGVIGYIGLDTIERTMRFVASTCAKRSRLIFSYGFLTFDPDDPNERVQALGFEQLEALGGDELWRRYLPGDAPSALAAMKLGIATV